MSEPIREVRIEPGSDEANKLGRAILTEMLGSLPVEVAAGALLNAITRCLVVLVNSGGEGGFINRVLVLRMLDDTRQEIAERTKLYADVPGKVH